MKLKCWDMSIFFRSVTVKHPVESVQYSCFVWDQIYLLSLSFLEFPFVESAISVEIMKSENECHQGGEIEPRFIPKKGVKNRSSTGLPSMRPRPSRCERTRKCGATPPTAEIPASSSRPWSSRHLVGGAQRPRRRWKSSPHTVRLGKTFPRNWK